MLSACPSVTRSWPRIARKQTMPPNYSLIYCDLPVHSLETTKSRKWLTIFSWVYQKISAVPRHAMWHPTTRHTFRKKAQKRGASLCLSGKYVTLWMHAAMIQAFRSAFADTGFCNTNYIGISMYSHPQNKKNSSAAIKLKAKRVKSRVLTDNPTGRVRSVSVWVRVSLFNHALAQSRQRM